MKKIFLIKLVLLLIFISLIFRWVRTQANISHKYIAIVIDDFGNNSSGTDNMIALPIAFTGAIMPQMPYSCEEADRLVANGKEIILHQPMEAHTGKRSWLGSVPILSSMNIEDVRKQFSNNINTLNVKGFNNHMGSLITEDIDKMTAILEIAKNKNMYFVDSLTTQKSVAEAVAKRLDIAYIKRDVFLDSTNDISKIKDNILKTAKIASTKGYAVAIGHVGAEGGEITAQALNLLCPKLQKEGYEFVTISQLLEYTN